MILFSMPNMLNAMMWITCAPISDKLEKVFLKISSKGIQPINPCHKFSLFSLHDSLHPHEFPFKLHFR